MQKRTHRYAGCVHQQTPRSSHSLRVRRAAGTGFRCDKPERHDCEFLRRSNTQPTCRPTPSSTARRQRPGQRDARPPEHAGVGAPRRAALARDRGHGRGGGRAGELPAAVHLLRRRCGRARRQHREPRPGADPPGSGGGAAWRTPAVPAPAPAGAADGCQTCSPCCKASVPATTSRWAAAGASQRLPAPALACAPCAPRLAALRCRKACARRRAPCSGALERARRALADRVSTTLTRASRARSQPGDAAAQEERRRGRVARELRFGDSPHCGHFRVHRLEYTAAVAAFLRDDVQARRPPACL